MLHTTPPKTRALLKGRRWPGQAVPVLIRIAPDVGERCALRMVDELCAASFLEKLNTAGTP